MLYTIILSRLDWRRWHHCEIPVVLVNRIGASYAVLLALKAGSSRSGVGSSSFRQEPLIQARIALTRPAAWIRFIDTRFSSSSRNLARLQHGSPNFWNPSKFFPTKPACRLIVLSIIWTSSCDSEALIRSCIKAATHVKRRCMQVCYLTRATILSTSTRPQLFCLSPLDGGGFQTLHLHTEA